jgi:CRISPR/Cas system Type II protein with McrA/HNH and RuvC-like nuclease domain
MRENPQNVNRSEGASTIYEEALAAIVAVLSREDLKTTEKCHRMAAIVMVEETPLSQERQAQRLAWAVWKKTGGHCTYCDEQLNPFERTVWNGFQVDHILPRAQGGTDDTENLTPACARCNWSKYARTPEEWRASL